MANVLNIGRRIQVLIFVTSPGMQVLLDLFCEYYSKAKLKNYESLIIFKKIFFSFEFTFVVTKISSLLITPSFILSQIALPTSSSFS